MKKILYILPLLILSFTLRGNTPSGWYQQFIPEIGNKPIGAIYFLDSLEGLSGTNIGGNDTNYILKTTNGGDNWFIVHREIKFFQEFSFINNLTGFVCGSVILKTTNSGDSWFSINFPLGKRSDDMSVLNEDTILFADANGFDGGVFRTTNGGTSWQQLFSGGPNNPNKIYMYDNNLGFISSTNNTFYRTTNGGVNWIYIPGVARFYDMNFIDSNTGWKCNGDFYKTTNGGLNWVQQVLPSKSQTILFSRINNFSVINKDTLWGVGGVVIVDSSFFRGMIYKTTDGGETWGFQIPDTNDVSIGQFSFIFFYDKSYGWAYNTSTGAHTVSGGNDTTIILGIKQTSTEIPDDFKLYQNYPNPFNPETKIGFKIKSSKYVKLIIYDITGKEIIKLVNQKMNAGEYEYTFNGESLSSGIYFYSLIIDANKIDKKKMMLVK